MNHAQRNARHPLGRRRMLPALAAAASVAFLAGCMGKPRAMVNVEPSYVHDRVANPDERASAVWPVPRDRQARAERIMATTTSPYVAETAFLEH